MVHNLSATVQFISSYSHSKEATISTEWPSNSALDVNSGESKLQKREASWRISNGFPDCSRATFSSCLFIGNCPMIRSRSEIRADDLPSIPWKEGIRLSVLLDETSRVISNKRPKEEWCHIDFEWTTRYGSHVTIISNGKTRVSQPYDPRRT